MPRTSRSVRRISLGSAASLVAILLAGCTGGASPQPVTPTVTVTATAQPTSTPAPTPAPKPTVAKSVTLKDSGIAVASDAGEITVTYDGGAQPAINALERVFGTVQPTFLAAGKCNADQTTYDFTALQLTYLGSDAAAASTFILSARTAPTTVDVSTQLGARVGGDFTTYVAKVPASQPNRTVNTAPRYDSVLESTTAGSESAKAGIVVFATDGVITSLSAPLDFDADC